MIDTEELSMENREMHLVTSARRLAEVLRQKMTSGEQIGQETESAAQHLLLMSDCIRKMCAVTREFIRMNRDMRSTIEDGQFFSESYDDTEEFIGDLLFSLDAQHEIMQLHLSIVEDYLVTAPDYNSCTGSGGVSECTRIRALEAEVALLKRERDDALSGVLEWGPTQIAVEQSLARFGDEIMFRTYDGKRVSTKELLVHLRDKTKIGVEYLSEIAAVSRATLRVRASDQNEGDAGHEKK